jgi:hypothetical protein
MVDMQMRASTVSMLSGGKLAAVNLSRNGSCRLFRSARCGSLVVAQPGVDDDPCDGVSTTSEWIDILGAALLIGKMRINQGQFPDLFLVASGRMKRVLPTVSVRRLS